MEYIRNNPEVSEAFKNEEVQLFFQRFLREMEDPYVLKQFLINGYEKTWKEQFDQIRKSFKVITYAKKKEDGFLEVERIVDGVRFKVGDKVVDLVAKENSKERILPIGRLYEDDRGLHVRLDVIPEPNLTLTWRDLSTVEHANPVIKELRDYGKLK